MSGGPRAAAEEAALVAKAINGDHHAFTALYDQHYDRIYRHVAYRVRRIEDIEDLTQQVFLQAWRGISRYRQTGSPFIAWLLTIAHNVIVSFYRRSRPAYSLEETATEPAAEEVMESFAEARLEGERVRQAIGRLKAEQQQVLIMRFLEHLEYRDIAQAVGKTEGNIRVIQHRALHELRRLLDRENG